jgi:two-component system phosphate regulon sensor histidine kinase PhoR
MPNWLRDRGIFLWSVFFLLVFLSLTLLAALGGWGLRGLIPLVVAALASAGAFTLALLRLARVPQRNWGRELRKREREFEQAREEVMRLTNEIRRKTDELTARHSQSEFLRQSLTELTASLDPRRVLDNILHGAIQVTGARWGSIFLLDEAGRPDNSYLCRMDSGGSRLDRILKKGFAGWVVNSQEGAVIYDTAQDPRWLTFPEDEEPARSAIAVPFVRRERVLGIMVVTHPLPFQFSEEHLALLQELAPQAAVCLENADLYTAAETERKKLAAILAGTTDAIIAVDTSSRVLLLNRAAERAFRVAAAHVLNRPLGERIAHVALNELFARALSCGEAVSGELTTDDERARYGSISPISDVGWVAVLQDITYLKELDRMKSEFVSTVSHDLRSPLTTVRGYADLVGILGPVTEQQREALEKIRRATVQMNELIGDLLDLGKIEAGIDMQMEPCPLSEIVAEIADSLAPNATLHGLDLQVVIAPELPMVQGNAGRMRQVVANLVGNAIKYTPQGGKIQVALARKGSEIVLSVSDTGIGIAPEDQEQLFQRFFRVRTPETEHIPGTGLGLAIVRSIVEMHGGRIAVESAPGKGSTFTVALPAGGL